MKNQVIEVLNKAHGAKVIEYWKKRGVDTGNKKGDCTKDDCSEYRFYGVINNCFECYGAGDVEGARAEIIQLPEERTFPRVMMVWDNLYAEGAKRVVFAFKNGLYISWCYAETLEDSETETATTTWRYAKEIDEPKAIELTVNQLLEKTSEIKKIFGLGESDELVIKI